MSGSRPEKGRSKVSKMLKNVEEVIDMIYDEDAHKLNRIVWSDEQLKDVEEDGMKKEDLVEVE